MIILIFAWNVYEYCLLFPTSQELSIGRGGRSKDKTGKQDCRSCPFKLSVLSVIKVCGSQLRKEKYCKNQINCRKHNLVYHRLNLSGCIQWLRPHPRYRLHIIITHSTCHECAIKIIPSAVGGDISKRHGIILAKSIPEVKISTKVLYPVHSFPW